MFVEADSCDDLRRAARQQLKAGADVLKVMGSGALMAPGLEPWGPHFSREEYEVIVTEARREGKRVAVHAHGTASIRAALDAGVASIEHGTFLCDEPDLLRRMAGEGVFLVPTLLFLQRIVDAGTGGGVPGFMVERARVAAAKHARSFRMALEHGVPIAFGADTGSPGCRHGENAEELRLMVRAGMSPVQALVAATSAAADCAGLADEVGTLEVGNSADIVVVNGDPTADIACLIDGIRAAVSRGRLVFSALGQQLPVVVS
jgi:imidazolonepropionase-like amidohydrolase